MLTWRLVLVALIFLIIPSQGVEAVSFQFTVDTTDDDPAKTACLDAVPDDCSLRGAIIAANTNVNPGEMDLIILPAGTYDLDEMGSGEQDAMTGDLDIRRDLRIEGAGADVTVIDANQIDRVFDINPKGTDSAEVIISGVTITGGLTPDGATVVSGEAGDGEGGGGVRISGGIVAFSHVLIDNNQTGDGGNSSFGVGDFGGDGGIGGGLFFQKGEELELENVTISNNLTGNGGDALFGGSGGGAGGAYIGAGLSLVNIHNVTISGNRTGETAGGTGSVGGGLYVGANKAIITLNNVTIANNRVGLDESTVGGNAGGLVRGSGDLMIGNSIIAGNQVGMGGINPDCQGDVISLGSNVIGDDSGCNGLDPGKGDTVADAKLEPLADNGGETPTHALMSDSPAVGLGGQDAVCEPADQRGLSRLVDGECDSGAFELGACGDGVVSAGEECDIGGDNADTCDAGFSCGVPGEADECTCISGDGGGDGGNGDQDTGGGCSLMPIH